MNFGAEIDNAAQTRVSLRFDKFPDQVHDRFLKVLTETKDRLIVAILAGVPVKSGTLQMHVSGAVFDHGNRIAAVAGVLDKTQQGSRKAAALEYGSKHTAVTVRAHMMGLDHFMARALNPHRTVNVPAYERTPNIDPRHFLRDAVQREKDSAIAGLRLALAEATEVPL